MEDPRCTRPLDASNQKGAIVPKGGVDTIRISNKPMPGRSEILAGPIAVRQVELSQPSPEVMQIIPKLGFKRLFLVLAVVMIVCGLEAVVRGSGIGAVALMFLIPVECCLAALFRRFPCYTFDRSGNVVQRRRIWIDRWTTLDQIVAIQVCYGGTYLKSADTGRGSQRIAYPSYQVNMVLHGPHGLMRETLAHHGDLPWIRAAGRQLADFLNVPLLNRLERD
jgi:hypothetical protein